MSRLTYDGNTLAPVHPESLGYDDLQQIELLFDDMAEEGKVPEDWHYPSFGMQFLAHNAPDDVTYLWGDRWCRRMHEPV